MYNKSEFGINGLNIISGDWHLPVPLETIFIRFFNESALVSLGIIYGGNCIQIRCIF